MRFVFNQLEDFPVYDGQIERVQNRDGTTHTFRRLNQALSQSLPTYFVVGMPVALDILDRLRKNDEFPLIDVDALLDSSIEGLFQRLEPQREHAVLAELIRECLVDNSQYFHDNLVSKQELELGLFIALQAVQQALIDHGLYTQLGVLPYYYLHRRGNHAIVLARRDRIHVY
jgi:hypothetical protein